MVQYSGQELKRTLAVSLSISLLYFALANAVLVGIGADTATSEVAEATPVIDNLIAELPDEGDGEAEPDLSGQAPIPVKDHSSLGRYQVQRGDSLYVIARMYDMTVDELKALNGLKSEIIRPGQVLTVSYGSVRDYPVGVRLSDQEVKWLAQMIYAESRGEPYLGQVAVGAVILNRLKSPQFPNTLYGVLFQRNAFQPIKNGAFFNEPDEKAYRAAYEALMGHDPTNGALYFFNPRQSNDKFMHSRPATVTIGRHRFMK
ncbi:MAG: LysM peptidoglycan-binding domain-containing protein [Firmicutes bacterium]|nr:LysM peptidoglycan-binding domain-containing protein [Bacillota bacterium]